MSQKETKTSILSLVPAGLDTGLESKSFRDLPHLQKMAGLVFLLLNVKRQSWGDTSTELTQLFRSESFRLEEEGKPHKTLGDLIEGSREFVSRWVELNDKNSKEIPEIIAKKIEELGNPFGLDIDVTRAVLEMANDHFETQLRNDSIKIGTYDHNWKPDPVEYFEEIIINMFEDGRNSGMSPFSNTDFPAGSYHAQIFPPDVARQVRILIQRRDDEIRARVKEKMAKKH
jgi:hypothetical protein